MLTIEWIVWEDSLKENKEEEMMKNELRRLQIRRSTLLCSIPFAVLTDQNLYVLVD